MGSSSGSRICQGDGGGAEGPGPVSQPFPLGPPRNFGTYVLRRGVMKTRRGKPPAWVTLGPSGLESPAEVRTAGSVRKASLARDSAGQ